MFLGMSMSELFGIGVIVLVLMATGALPVFVAAKGLPR